MLLAFLSGGAVATIGVLAGIWIASKLNNSIEVRQLQEQLEACLDDYERAQARYKSTLGNLQKLQQKIIMKQSAPWETPKGE